MTLSDIYLDGTNGDDADTGEDWDNAVKTWSDALSKVSTSGTIHVKVGSYSTSGTLTTKSIEIHPMRFGAFSETIEATTQSAGSGGSSGISCYPAFVPASSKVMRSFTARLSVSNAEGGEFAQAVVLTDLGNNEYKVKWKGSEISITATSATDYQLMGEDDEVMVTTDDIVGVYRQRTGDSIIIRYNDGTSLLTKGELFFNETASPDVGDILEVYGDWNNYVAVQSIDYHSSLGDSVTFS